MPYILAIDQSTSATKALLFDAAIARPLDHASAEHRQIYPRPGWVEHDAEEIWQNVLNTVETVVGRNEHRLGELLCLSITNQRETFVLFDRATGRPLHNAIVWQCRRGEPVCEELRGLGATDDVVTRKTGLRIDTYFSGSKIAWLMRHEPQLAAKVRRGEALVGTIDAYLVYRLTNGGVFATDHTNASRTLLFDIHALAWDDELCRLFGVPRAALPAVRESGARFGETDFGGLLPRRIPICGVMGDSQAALLAHGCMTPGTAKVTFGTGSSVLLNIGAVPDGSPSDALPLPCTQGRSERSWRLPARGQGRGAGPKARAGLSDPRHASRLPLSPTLSPAHRGEGARGSVTSLAWVINGEPTYCLEGIINYSAATLAWLRDRLGVIQSFDDAEPLARAAGDNGGVYLVPAFAGLGAPYWQPEARAAVVGLTAHSGREHVVRAALESIAYQVRDVLEMMRDESGVELQAIHADGGATANRFLMQFTADLLGLEVKVADAPECSALGAALAGALGTGVYRSAGELAGLPRQTTSYRPAMDAARVQENHAGWRRAVESVVAAQHRSAQPVAVHTSGEEDR